MAHHYERFTFEAFIKLHDCTNGASVSIVMFLSLWIVVCGFYTKRITKTSKTDENSMFGGARGMKFHRLV